MRQIVTSLLLLFSFCVSAQNITVKGVVKDAQSKEGLPYCNVFINNTSLGVNTDLNGNFTMSGIKMSEFDLVFTYVGYFSSSKKITATANQVIEIEIFLNPSDVSLSEVEVKSKRDKKWEKQLKKFENFFFGFNDFASDCSITNAWVLDFEEKGETFSAKSSQPLLLLNLALGYQLLFDLKEFSISPELNKIGGNVKFTELIPRNKEQLEKWLINRSISYKKSPAYFFNAAVNAQLAQSGIKLFITKPGSNSIRSDNFDIELGKTVMPYDFSNNVSLGNKPDIKKIFIPTNLEIHNEASRSDRRTYSGITYGVSWMNVNKNYVSIDNKGNILNPTDIVVSGDMDLLKVSGMLPIDYDPSASANEAYFLKFEEKKFYETVHLHLDRNVYYENEKVWFKAYLNYSSFSQLDTASKVLYVQLVNSDKKIIETQKLEISNGYAYGQMLLDSSAGDYQIRAFTQYMQNFNKNCIVQYIKVLSPDQYFDQNTIEPIIAGDMNINLEKTKDGNLEVGFVDKQGRSLGANFSVSIVQKGYNFKVEPSIFQDLNIDNIKYVKGNNFEKELGINLKGVFLDKKREPVGTDFNVFVNGLDNFAEGKSNQEGNFSLQGLTFFDDSPLYFQSVSKKYREGYFVLKNDAINVPVQFLKPEFIQEPLSSSNSQMVQNLKISQDEKEKKEDKKSENRMLYGRPDYVIEGQEISSQLGLQGLVNAILRKVPNTRYANGGFIFRGGTTSIFNSQNALILLDGVPMGNFSMVDPFQVKKIEIVNRMVNMYGDQGRNGVVSVFLKDENDTSSPMLNGKNISKMIVRGYERPQTFTISDYVLKKNNLPITLLWIPEIITDEKEKAKIPFKSAVSAVVEIKGISSNNRPFQKYFDLNVE
jgi:hypothetical protein